MGRLDGKVALISGGARGMGESEARLFAQEGAAVVIGDILDEAGEAVAAYIANAGGRCYYTHLDVREESDWQAAVAAAVSRFGMLNVLVNNAGIGSSSSPIHEEPVEVWGPYYGCERERRVPGRQDGDTGDAPSRRRLHHQHFVAVGDCCRTL